MRAAQRPGPGAEPGKRIDADAQLALELAICDRAGISHSHFLGGPPVWTADDRDKAVWWEIHRREQCGECGTRADEWDPQMGGHDVAYRTELRKCWGCAAKTAAQRVIKEDDASSVRVVLVKNPEVR